MDNSDQISLHQIGLGLGDYREEIIKVGNCTRKFSVGELFRNQLSFGIYLSLASDDLRKRVFTLSDSPVPL